MKRSELAKVSLCALLAGLTAGFGCSDDEAPETDDAAGSGGQQAGSGGRTGGSSGKSTTDAGGDVGGSHQSEAGSGGAAGGVENGGGSGGSGAEPGGPITRVATHLLERVHDLRGLNYAASGKIYGSGHTGSDPSAIDRQIAIVRLNEDGSPDDSFGDEGVVTYNLVERIVETIPGAGGTGGAGGAGGAGGGDIERVVNDGDEQSLGIVELTDGDLMVQANVRDSAGKGTDVVLLRLNDVGELVTTFGDGGVQRLDLGWTDADLWTTASAGPNDQAWGLSLDPSSGEEKVVVYAFGPAPAGQTTGNPAVQRTDNDRYLARVLTSDGSLDPDFNGGRVFSLNTGGTFSDNARRGLVEPDGSIVSAGYTNYGDLLGNHVVLIRLEPDGTLDPDFGFGIATPGVARTNPFLDDGGVAECYQVGKQSTGRYVTTGYGRATAPGNISRLGWVTTDAVDLVSVGILPEGVDISFGRQGTLAIQSEEVNLGNTEDRGRDLVTLPDDRIVFVGRFGPHPAIFVSTPDGELDVASGEAGRFLYDPLPDVTSHFFRVALSQGGTRLAATTSNHASGVLVAVLDIGTE